MAVSDVDVANLALQKLGAKRIALLSENTREAKSINSCFETLRDIELATYAWNFAKDRQVLAPHATAPAFTFARAFILPNGCLNIIKPARLGLDWHVELHAGEPAILTNDGTSINLRFIKKVTDPNKMHPLFIEMWACKMAWHVAEELTQSNTKRDAMMVAYNMARAQARKINAFSVNQQVQPVDAWLASRQNGQLVNTEWNEE